MKFVLEKKLKFNIKFVFQKDEFSVKKINPVCSNFYRKLILKKNRN